MRRGRFPGLDTVRFMGVSCFRPDILANGVERPAARGEANREADLGCFEAASHGRLEFPELRVLFTAGEREVGCFQGVCEAGI